MDQVSDRYNHQLELEKLHNKNQTLPRIRQFFQEHPDVDFQACFQANGIPLKFGFDLLAQIALHRQADVPTMINVLRHHQDGLANASQITADLLLKCAELDLIDWAPDIRKFVVCFPLSQEVERDLELYQYPLPMIVEPQPLESNTDSGYLLGAGSVILRKNHTTDDVCLDHLNRANAVRFSLDYATAAMVKLKWSGLDKQASDETREKFEQRKKAFEKYKRITDRVMSQLLAHGNEFYLTHKYDKRGRSYCQGYHVSYQAAPWNKAVLQFAEKEIIA